MNAVDTTYVTPEEFAAILRMDPERVRERLRAGDLPYLRVPGSSLYRIPLEAALAACTERPRKKPAKSLVTAAAELGTDRGKARFKELFG
jgi:hypothetical protein